MKFSVLSSSSKANALVVQESGTTILIDCGLSARACVERMREVGIDPEQIDAVLITHEHSDHVAGVKAFTNKFKVPVYTTDGTRRAHSDLREGIVFYPGDELSFKGLTVSSFPTVHDAAESVGFVVKGSCGQRLGIATDLGKVTTLVRTALQGVHALILESNHDKELLHSCSYPWALKQRISSSHGHLSNDAARELLQEIWWPGLSTVILAHLSENSNTPQHALHSVQTLSLPSSVQFYLGSRATALPLLEVVEERTVEELLVSWG